MYKVPSRLDHGCIVDNGGWARLKSRGVKHSGLAQALSRAFEQWIAVVIRRGDVRSKKLAEEGVAVMNLLMR